MFITYIANTIKTNPIYQQVNIKTSNRTIKDPYCPKLFSPLSKKAQNY